MVSRHYVYINYTCTCQGYKKSCPGISSVVSQFRLHSDRFYYQQLGVKPRSKALRITDKPVLLNTADNCRIDLFLPLYIHGMQTRSSDENSVCTSVCLYVCPSVKRVDCDKTEEQSVQIFIPYERSFSLVF